MRYSLILALFLLTTTLSAQVKTEIEGGLKIGNTSLLDEGIIRFTGTDFQGRLNGNWYSLMSTSSNGAGLWSNQNNDIFYDLGKVGIGLSNPQSQFHIKGNSNLFTVEGADHAYIDWRPEGLNGSVRAHLGYRWPNDREFRIHTSGIQQRIDMNSTRIRISTDEDIRLDNFNGNIILEENGFVGIGTSNPAVKLQVENGSDVSLTGGYLQLGSTSGANIAMDNNEIQARSNGALSTLYIQNEGGDLAIAKNGGNVGVGTTTPKHLIDLGNTLGKKLAVYQNSGGTGFYGFGISSSTLEFHASSNITDGPDAALKSNGDFLFYSPGGSTGLIHIGSPDGNPGIVLRSNIPEDYRADIRRSIDGLHFDVGATTSNPAVDFTIANYGNAGFGTTSPSQKIDAKGIIRSTYVSNNSEYIEFYHGGSNGFINTVGDGDLDFRHDGVTLMSLADSGKVIIGEPTTPGNYKLFVDGGILAEEVKVALSNASEWADDAFEKTPTIQNVKSSIEENSHLKEMPSADFLVENGFSLKEMDAKLLRQIEWLWMHMIRVSEENQQLNKEIKSLLNKLEKDK